LLLFDLFGDNRKRLNAKSLAMVDSLPIAACDNHGLPRAKLYRHEEYRGYIASKKRYFYGLKIHLLVSKNERPVECFMIPGLHSNMRPLKTFRFDIPEPSYVYAEKGYNDYRRKDVLPQARRIQPYPIREKNSPRTLLPCSTRQPDDIRSMITER
jgi:hypothetical protein